VPDTDRMTNNTTASSKHIDLIVIDIARILDGEGLHISADKAA
jgi:hypothetical protein